MTLIELLLEYQRLWKEETRLVAAQWLRNVCDESLWEHVEGSFNDAGELVDVDGWPVHFRTDKPSDYEPCGYCGFDHEYEYAEAHKWHSEHPGPEGGYDNDWRS
jgi:hypothetical protein